MQRTRRDFLRLSTAAGVGTLAAACGNGTGAPDSGSADTGSTDDATTMDGAGADASTDDVPVQDTAPIDGGTVRTRVLIVGSGFGGAVTALRLAQANIDSVILERGRRWPITPQFNTFSNLLLGDRRSTWMSRRTVLPFGPQFNIPMYAGVLQRVEGNGINLYAGAGVGGGSLVYGGFAVVPRESAFTRIFNPSITYAEMRDVYYPRALMQLRGTTIPADVLAHSAFNSERVFNEHARRANVETTQVNLTVDWDIVRREIAGTIPESALSGEVIYGNNNGCKISLDYTYLAQAERTGKCTIEPLHQVKDVTQLPSGEYGVFVERISETGAVLETKMYVTEYLFLAAGTYGTTNLLVKAKAKGLMPRLDDRVGQGFGNNGNAMFMRWGLPELTGPRQASFGGQAMVDFNNPVSPALVEHAQFPSGAECNCLLQLGMALDVGRGTFRYDATKDAAVVDWPANGNEVAAMAMQNLADRLNTANMGRLNGMSSGVTVEGVLSGFTYHPVGGMVMGEATDYFGRVNNHPKLYTIDGSMLPRSAGGVNPALTITALAERSIERVIREDFRTT